MNKLSIEVKATETHEKAIAYFKATEQFAYKFFMEVKKIRDERLFQELGFPSFDEYCSKNFNLTRQFINQKIQIADTFGESSETRVSELGHIKSLALSRLEPEEREDFIQSNPVDKMTVLQLQQAIKEKKQAEARIAELENRKPEIKIVEKEIVKEILPNDYQQLKEKSELFAELEKSLKLKETQLQEIKKEDSEYSRKKSEIQREVKELLEQKEDIERQQDKVNLQSKILVKLTNAITPLKKNAVEIEQLLDQNLQYLDLYTIRSIEIEIKYLYKFIDMLQSKISQEVDIIDY